MELKLARPCKWKVIGLVELHFDVNKIFVQLVGKNGFNDRILFYQ